MSRSKTSTSWSSAPLQPPTEIRFLTQRSRASRRKPRNRRRELLDTPGSVAYNACTLKIRVPRSAGWLASPTANLFDIRRAHMNKHELIAKIAQDTGLTKTSATAAVESFFDG